MRRNLPTLAECLLAGGLTLLGFGALAADAATPTLTIAKPWTRATPANAPVAGGYMTITNTGGEPERLTGGDFGIAGKIEVHEMAMNNGIMTMRPLQNGLEIKPGASIELKPGSYHLMLMGLKGQLKQGETLKGTLTFEKAGKVPVELSVESMGATTAPMQMNH